MKTFEKILQTIVWVCIGLFGLFLTFSFYYGYKTMDDDILFISGLCMVVYVSTILLVRMVVFDIYAIWHKSKKRKGRKDYE